MKIQPLALSALIVSLFSGAAFGQTTTTAPVTVPSVSLQNVTLPAYVLFGMSYNQFGTPSMAGLFSAIQPESQNVGLLGSVSVDLLPVQYTDPTTKKTGHVFSGQVRFGQHKVLAKIGRVTADNAFHPAFVMTIGGDVGPSFSSSPTTTTTAAGTGTTSSVSIGLAGSFTVGGFYQFSQHWAAGLAVRALYMSGVGPNGTGAWNPVLEPSLVFVK